MSDKYHQTVEVWENCIETAGEWDLGFELGIQPKGCSKKADIQFAVDNMDPDEREAREKGKFQHLSGLVYKTYKKELHFRQLAPVVNPKNYVYQFVLDPHDRRPPACIWVRIDRFNRKTIIRDWPGPDDSCFAGRLFKDIKSADPYKISDFVKFWIEIEEELEIPNNRLQSIIDPNYGKKPNRSTGNLLYEDYQEEFYKQGRSRTFVVDAIDDLKTGHQAVKDYLKPMPDGDLKLVVGDNCPNVDWSFRNYKYLEWKGKTGEDKDLRINVAEYGKDYCDLARYMCVVPFAWYPLPRYEESGEGDYVSFDRYMSGRPEGADGI